MTKESPNQPHDALQPEYDLSRLKADAGKYYRRASAGTNLVLIAPDLADIPDSESVNRALRLLADTAQAAMKKKRRRS